VIRLYPLTEISRSPLKSEQVRIRPATSADSAEVLRWRNDQQAREQSRTTEIITQDVHDAWFESVIEDPDRYLFIAELEGGVPFGQVRFDLLAGGSDVFEVSISIATEFRGQDLAIPTLLQAEGQFRLDHSPRQLRAFVRLGNTISQRIFAAAGYSIDSTVNDSGNWWFKDIND
jgi:RimJ/RimL family protein N-acetyltransferase